LKTRPCANVSLTKGGRQCTSTREGGENGREVLSPYNNFYSKKKGKLKISGLQKTTTKETLWTGMEEYPIKKGWGLIRIRRGMNTSLLSKSTGEVLDIPKVKRYFIRIRRQNSQGKTKKSWTSTLKRRSKGKQGKRVILRKSWGGKRLNRVERKGGYRFFTAVYCEIGAAGDSWDLEDTGASP